MLFSSYGNPQRKIQREFSNHPLMLWCNAAVAPIFIANNKDWRIFGGYYAGKKERVQKDYSMLQEEYRVVNREELLEKLNELSQTGVRFHYNHLMEEYRERGFFDLSREQLCMDDLFPQLELYQRRWLYDMIQGYKAYDKRALLGYDISRAIYAAEAGFMVGHIEQEETFNLCLEFAKTLQAAFSCWEELTNSYLLGYAFQTQEDKQNLSSSLAHRIHLVEQLYQDKIKGPFTLDWNTRPVI